MSKVLRIKYDMDCQFVVEEKQRNGRWKTISKRFGDGADGFNAAKKWMDEEKSGVEREVVQKVD